MYGTRASIRIAVLMTCFNRRDTTMRCLSQLYAQTTRQDVDYEVYLVDDGSDGTGDQVEAEYPAVHVCRGDGSLFWCGGMRRAFDEAAKDSRGFDYYLWLNDDITMAPDAVDRLIGTHQTLAASSGAYSITVGTFADPVSGAVTYGGVVRKGLVNRLSFQVIGPVDEPTPCDTLNGNMVLIPQSVVARVGNLERRFRHSMGDFDYGLRARQAGGSVWIAPGIVGTCSRNSPKGSWEDDAVPVRDRWRKVLSPKGLPPREVLHFYRTHGGILWPINYLRFYLRITWRISKGWFVRQAVG